MIHTVMYSESHEHSPPFIRLIESNSPTEPKSGEDAFAPRIIEKVVSQSAPDGCASEFVCRVEGNPRPQITWFRQTAIIKPSQDFQGSVQQSRPSLQLVVQCCNLPQLLNTHKSVPL